MNFISRLSGPFGTALSVRGPRIHALGLFSKIPVTFRFLLSTWVYSARTLQYRGRDLMKTLQTSVTLLALASLASVSNAETIFDQLATNSGVTGTTSQDFEPLNDNADAIAIDDFTIGSSYSLTSFTFGAVFNSLNAPANVTGYKVSIYSPAASTTAATLDGDVAAISLLPVSATTNLVNGRGTITLDLTSANVVLAPGTYSIGVTTSLSFSPNGERIFNLFGAQAGGGNNGRFINPGGGFGVGPNSQIVASTTGQGVNLNYKLEAEAVPEPASMAALGLGAVALLRRRRKA
ncbi:PEP-CTERM sorting domain-containing protein [bacterium]|nr:MAG: PEP-CTERM sorting domain-containing protein [bacterium]